MRIHNLIITIFVSMISVSVAAQTSDREIAEKCLELYSDGLYNETLECLNRHKNNIYAVYFLAYIGHLNNDSKTYKKNKKRLISKKLKCPEAYELYAHLNNHNPKSYEKALKKGLNKYPNDTIILIYEVNRLIEINDYKNLIVYSEKIIKHSKTPLKEYYYTLANAQQQTGLYSDAIYNYQQSIKIDSYYADAHYNIGSLFFNLAVDIIEDSDESNTSTDFATIELYMNNALTHLKIADSLIEDSELDSNLQNSINTIKSYLKIK
jgi:hypothetical protein